MRSSFLSGFVTLILVTNSAEANFGLFRPPPRTTAYYYVPVYYPPASFSFSLYPSSIPLYGSGSFVIPLESTPLCCEPTPPVCEAPLPRPVQPPPATFVPPATIFPTPEQSPRALPQTAPPSPDSQLPPLPSTDDGTSRKPSISEQSRQDVVSRFVPANGNSSVAFKPVDRLPKSEFKIYPSKLSAEMPGADRYNVTLWNLTPRTLRLTIGGTTRVLERGKQSTLELPQSFAWQVQGNAQERTSVPSGERGITIAIRR